MDMPKSDPEPKPVNHGARTWWSTEARRLAKTWFIAWWGYLFAPAYVGAGLVLAVSILFNRSFDMNLSVSYAAVVVVLVVGAVVAFFAARKRALTPRSALARLDDRLELDGQLLAADDGVAAWPSPSELSRKWGIRLHIARIIPQLIGVPILSVLAALVPAQRREVPAADMGQPLVWREMQEWIDRLEEEKLIAEPDLQVLEKRLEALRRPPAETWFKDSSLEAGEHARDQMAQQLEDLRKRMEDFEAASSSDLPFEDAAQSERTSKAFEELGSRTPSLSKDFLDDLKSLSSEDAESESGDGSEAGKKAREAARSRLKNGIRILDDLDSGEQQHDGDGPSKGANGEPGGDGGSDQTDLGTGGVSRGPGPAPLVLNPKGAPLMPLNPEALPKQEGEPTLGEAVRERGRIPDANVGDTGSKVAGGVRSAGKGGEGISLDGLTPKEQTIVRKYFK